MADVIAVTHVSQLQPAQPAKALLEREEIRQRLARMEPVGERVDHGDGGAGGQLVEYALLVGARDDAVHPALHVPGHDLDRLPLVQARAGVILKYGTVPHSRRADSNTTPLYIVQSY